MLSIITALLGFFKTLAALFVAKKIEDAGETKAENKVLTDTVNEVTEANDARQKVAIANAHVDPAVGVPDDGFRRD